MKVLAVFRDTSQLARVGSQLREIGHDVMSADNRAAAATKVLQAVPQVAIIDPQLPLAEGLGLVKMLRSISSSYIYVLAASRALDDDQLHQVYEAGADGEIRSLATRDLADRLAVAGRLLAKRGAPVEAKPGAAAAAAAPATPPKPADIDLPALASSVSDALSTLVGLPASIVAPEQDAELAHATGIQLANVERELKLYLSLGVSREAASVLSTHMFGEVSDELARDMLGELANISMGTTKALLAKSSIPFTGSLPEAIEPGQFVSFGAAGQRIEAATIVLQGVRVHLRIALASSQNITVTAAKLRQGMVLVNDVFNPRGVLVLVAKTRLSETAVARLQSVLPPTQSIEVATGGM